jgi:hypothetical protein
LDEFEKEVDCEDTKLRGIIRLPPHEAADSKSVLYYTKVRQPLSFAEIRAWAEKLPPTATGGGAAEEQRRFKAFLAQVNQVFDNAVLWQTDRFCPDTDDPIDVNDFTEDDIANIQVKPFFTTMTTCSIQLVRFVAICPVCTFCEPGLSEAASCGGFGARSANILVGTRSLLSTDATGTGVARDPGRLYRACAHSQQEELRYQDARHRAAGGHLASDAAPRRRGCRVAGPQAANAGAEKGSCRGAVNAPTPQPVVATLSILW